MVPIRPKKTSFVPVKVSLENLLGSDYGQAVCQAASVLQGTPSADFWELFQTPVDFLPDSFQARQWSLLEQVGTQVCSPATHTAEGATTNTFAAATRKRMTPLSGCGLFRIGEDGRLYLITKSEHYHVSLGHAFPGWRLIEHARRLGIPNATHNNTRGHVTRRLEEELIALVHGLDPREPNQLGPILTTKDPWVVNRVLNLETGSLALEAAVKLVLSRFYRPQLDSPAPPYEGRTPVLLVMGDEQGDLTANYHGTTVLTQTMRGMWQELRHKLESGGLYRVRAVRVNDLAGLERAFAEGETGPCKVAGFFLELVLMNYGALTLNPDFLARLSALCRAHAVPLIVDEIQTGLWSPQMFMFREYGLQPAMIGLGKGFPGGEYASSRLLFAGGLDTLPQFGALVTNGQEELAALAYLIGIHWARENREVIGQVGAYYEERLRDLGGRHAQVIQAIHGRRHLLGIHFHELAVARKFVQALESAGLDISVQTYKTQTPPAALTKLPLLAGYEVMDAILDKMSATLATL